MERQDNDQVEDSKAWLHFRGIPVKEVEPGSTRATLVSLCEPFGKVNICAYPATQRFDKWTWTGQVIHVVVMHGRKQALVLMEHSSCADRFFAIYGASGIAVNGWSSVVVAKGNERSVRSDWNAKDARVIRQEVQRCLERVVKSVITTDAQQRRILRRKQREQHKLLIRQSISSTRTSSGTDAARANVCWDFVRGKCPRGRLCTFSHESVPISELPPQYRTFVAKDAFPVIRGLSPDKTMVNEFLVCLSGKLPNKRCLVLDGARCNSVRALLGCQDQCRTSNDIVVPNYCTDTFLRIREQGLCTAYYGSLRAYIDSHPEEAFGLVYLDYCSRLRAGQYEVEKSPIADIEALMAHRICDARGSVLAVCLCMEDATSELDAPQVVRHLVCLHAARNGLVAVPCAKRFTYPGNFVELFSLASIEHSTSFFTSTFHSGDEL
jgi:hypothetical protein